MSCSAGALYQVTHIHQATQALTTAWCCRKAAELGAIGAASGAVMSAGGSAALAIRRRSDPGFQPSVPVPELGRSAQGMALSLGAFSNLRYQAVSGIDRVLFERGPWLWANLATTTALRAAAHLVAQPTRLFLQVGTASMQLKGCCAICS